MISVQNNGITPVNPPKQDNKTNLPLVIGSTLGFGALAGAVAHNIHSYKEEGNVISTKLDRYTKKGTAFTVETGTDIVKNDHGSFSSVVHEFQNGKLMTYVKNDLKGDIAELQKFDDQGQWAEGLVQEDNVALKWVKEKGLNGELNYRTDVLVDGKVQASHSLPPSKNGNAYVFDTDIEKLSPDVQKKLSPLTGEGLSVHNADKTISADAKVINFSKSSDLINTKLPKTFEEVVPYLKAQRNMQTALWGIGVGVLAGGSAFLISRLTAKKPQAVPPQTTS